MARTMAVAALLCLVAAACFPAQVPGPSLDRPPGSASLRPGDSNSPIAESDVAQVISDLASIGVAVFASPTHAEPVSEVRGDPSRVRLLSVQARSLAVEWRTGGGPTGAQLDELAAAVDAPPVSGLISAWADAAGSAASEYGASVVRWSGNGDPADARYPGLALVAFLADATRGQATARGEPSRPVAGGGSMLAMRGAGSWSDHGRASAADDFCADLSRAVVAAVDGLIVANPAIPDWLHGLMLLHAPAYADDPTLFHHVVGALGLAIHATTLARPWWVNLDATPLSASYTYEGEDRFEGEVDLTIIRDPGWEDEIADCAELAGVELEPGDLEGATVVWSTAGLAPHAEPVDANGALDEEGQAELHYVTAVECRRPSGDPTVTDQIWVGALVERAENSRLREAVEAILLGEAYGSPLSSTAAALYQHVRPQLLEVAWAGGVVTIDVVHHSSPCASPTPSPSAAATPAAGHECLSIVTEAEVEAATEQDMTFSPAGSGPVLGTHPGQMICTYGFDASPAAWDAIVTVNVYRDEAIASYHLWLDGYRRTNPVRGLAGIPEASWDPVSMSAWVIVGSTGLSVAFWGPDEVLGSVDLESAAAQILRLAMMRV